MDTKIIKINYQLPVTNVTEILIDTNIIEINYQIPNTNVTVIFIDTQIIKLIIIYQILTLNFFFAYIK